MLRISLKNNQIFVGVCLVVFALSACKGEDVYYQKFEGIEGEEWEMNSPVSFDFDIIDTNTIYDFSLNLRNTTDYQYSNVFVFWQLQSPDGRIKTDTSEFILAKPNGQWLGKSVSGTVIENSMVFLRKKLPIKGNYTFTFTQGMRETSLDNIKDVGLKIVKKNEQNN